MLELYAVENNMEDLRSWRSLEEMNLTVQTWCQELGSPALPCTPLLLGAGGAILLLLLVLAIACSFYCYRRG